MVVASRPDIAVQIAFNADPNDPAAVPTWSDLTALFLGASGAKRGKQYELDQVQASDPTLDFLDPNEYLNPGNPSSPYQPGLLPLRQILLQGVWPNTTAGNLLNAGSQGQAYDCSFESYTAGASVPWITAVGGVSATVAAANAHGGTKSLQYPVVGGATVQGVSVTVACIPGRQYTASWWVRQSSASTQQIAVTGVATGTSTTSTGAYVRLTVTFTATQPTHVITLQTSGTAVAGTINLDDLQLEQGATATTATTTGPVIYGVLRDYIESLPAEWDQDSAGYLGLCSLTAVDAFAALAAVDLGTEYHNAVMAKAPALYYPLSDASGATVAAETSGNGGPGLTRLDSSFGPGPTFALGAATSIAGDPGGTGFTTDTGSLSANIPASVLQAGTRQVDSPLPFVLGPTPCHYTVAFWAARGPTAPAGVITNGYVLLGTDSSGISWQVCVLYVDQASNMLNVIGSFPPTAHAPGLTVADTWADSKMHLYTIVVDVVPPNITLTVYIDGVQVGQTTAANATTMATTFTASSMQIGGDIPVRTLAGGSAWNNGLYAHLALWSRALTGAEIADLVSAGSGYPGEGSGARVTRYLGYGWNGTSAVDTGQSTMGVSTLAKGTSLLAACQGVATSENGNFFADGVGRVTYQGRTRRYLATTSAYTFGENVAGGELPYEGDIKFEFDRTQIYNDVAVTRSGGITAVAADATSKKRYFPRDYPRTINVSSDLEAIDAANWILATHKDPVQRVEQITLNPGANPNLWPVVLSLELGTRVTVKKRSKAANNGAGLTQSGDFFVESIEHSGIDMEAGTWTTTLLLSPASSALQPWILGDATYGQLGVTTILGY